jgi:hypothetical protein
MRNSILGAGVLAVTWFALIRPRPIHQETTGKTVDAATAAYETGAVEFLSLVSNLTNLITLERQYYDEVARHEEAIARLEAVVGRELIPFQEAGQ